MKKPSERVVIKKIVIGLLYTCIQLEDGTAGVSYTLTDRYTDRNAYHQLLQNGFLSEKTLIQLIDYCSSKYAIMRTIGVAALNTYCQDHIDFSNATDRDVSELIDLQSDLTIGMVGNIHPITRYLSKKEVSLRILDKYAPASPTKHVTPVSKVSDLKSVDQLLVSGSALVFDTFDEIIGLLPHITGKKIFVGPSAQILPELAFKLGFSAIGSSKIIDSYKTIHILQEGGGYRFFKKFTGKYSFVKRK